MRKIRIANPDLTKEEKTYLDADYTSGTTLTVQSNLGFQNNYIAVVGQPGVEQTEAKDVTGTTGSTTITISGAFSFDHNKGVPIYRSVWYSISIERYASGVWTEITDSEIDWDKSETIYIDTTGSDSHSYRFRFHNVYLGIYSEYSPTIAGSGFSYKQVGYMIQQVRKNTGDLGRSKVSDGDIIRLLSAGQDTVAAIRSDWWFNKVDTFKQSNGIATVASTYRYSLATYTDLNYLSRVRFNYNDGTDNRIYDLEPLTDIEFDEKVKDLTRQNDDNVQCFKIVQPDINSAQGYIEVYPTPKTSGYGTIYPEYYRTMTALNDVSDTTDLPIPQLLEDYASWKINQLLGNEEKALLYKDLFFGPPPEERDRSDLSGVALLAQMNTNKKKAIGKLQSIWNYRGRRSIYTEKVLDRDTYVENYF